MGRVELTNGYLIESDPMCFILKCQKVKKNKKTGAEEEYEAICGYFGTISQAVEKFLFLTKADKKGDKSLTFREYVEAVEKSNNKAVKAITKALKEHGGLNRE